MLREYADNSMREKEILKNSLADISHQLKTPLTSILITTENILDDDDMPVEIRRDFVMDIAHNAHSINFLVKSLLTLSMLDSGTVELKFGDVSVEKIIDECISRTEVLADIRDVRIEKTVKNDFMPVLSDAQPLHDTDGGFEVFWQKQPCCFRHSLY